MAALGVAGDGRSVKVAQVAQVKSKNKNKSKINSKSKSKDTVNNPTLAAQKARGEDGAPSSVFLLSSVFLSQTFASA